MKPVHNVGQLGSPATSKPIQYRGPEFNLFTDILPCMLLIVLAIMGAVLAWIYA